MKTTKMKAYKVNDREYYCDYACVVFAETRGKAIAAALGTDEFPLGDWNFTELKAVRVPELDKYYRGLNYMDWDYMPDRIALVQHAGFLCSDPDEDECRKCEANCYCGAYEDLLYERSIE